MLTNAVSFLVVGALAVFLVLHLIAEVGQQVLSEVAVATFGSVGKGLLPDLLHNSFAGTLLGGLSDLLLVHAFGTRDLAAAEVLLFPVEFASNRVGAAVAAAHALALFVVTIEGVTSAVAHIKPISKATALSE